MATNRKFIAKNGLLTPDVTTPLVTNAGTLAVSATGSNVITASTNNAERLRIDNDGNVGINTTSPTERLHVNGRVRLGSQASNTTHAVRADRTISTGSGLSGGGNLTANRTLSVDSSVVRTSGNQTIGGVKTFTDQVIVQNDNLGLRLETSDSPYIRFDMGGTGNSGQVYRMFSWGSQRTLSMEGMGDVQVVIDHNNNQSDKAFSVRHNGAGTSGPELFRVQENGRVGIGVNSPSESLHVSGKIRIGTQATATTDAVRADRTISTGSGLSGGGNLTSNRTLSVDSSVVRTSGNQSISGTKTFTGSLVATNLPSGTTHFESNILQLRSGGSNAILRGISNDLRLGAESNIDLEAPFGTTRVRILNNGNVGIGTTSPGSALQVQGSITGTAVTQSATDTTSGRLLKVGDFGLGSNDLDNDINAPGDNIEDLTYAGFFGTNSNAQPYGHSSGISIPYRRDGGSGNQISHYLIFNTSESPQASIATFRNGSFEIEEVVTGNRTISTGSGLSGGGNLSANRTLSVDSSVVRTSGNQTISGNKTFTGRWRTETTSGAYVQADTGFGARLIWFNPTDNNAFGLFHRNVANFEVVRNSSMIARFSAGGDFLATGTIQAGSDRRFKTNIETIDDALEKLTQLRGVYYTRTDTDNADQVHTGVIAQEVLPVLPEVVGGDEQSGYSVAYGHMAGLFIEAIKSQQATIEQLDRRVRELESQNTNK